MLSPVIGVAKISSQMIVSRYFRQYTHCLSVSHVTPLLIKQSVIKSQDGVMVHFVRVRFYIHCSVKVWLVVWILAPDSAM